jgi:hypothetical protein
VKRGPIAAILVALTLTSCGDPSMSRAVARDLRRDVAAIRAAVEDGRAFLAKQRLTALNEQVVQLLDRGRIDGATAAEIAESIDVVRAALPSLPAPGPTVVETPSPSPPEDGGDEGEGNAYGKDKGEGHGDEGHGNDD